MLRLIVNLMIHNLFLFSANLPSFSLYSSFLFQSFFYLPSAADTRLLFHFTIALSLFRLIYAICIHTRTYVLCMYSVCFCCKICSFSFIPSLSQCEYLATLTRMFVNYTKRYRVIRFYDEALSVNVVYPRCSQLCFLFLYIFCCCSSHNVFSINASTIHTQHMHCIHTFSSTVCMLTHSHAYRGGRVDAQHDLISFPHTASTDDHACVRYVMCVCVVVYDCFAAAAPLLYRRHFLVFSRKRVSNRYASILQTRNVSEKFFSLLWI